MHEEDDDDWSEEGDLLGWRTGRRAWTWLDYGRREDGGEGRGVGPKNYTRSEERILHDVCERLKDSDLDVSEVDVRVEDSEVILEGVVNDRFTKRAVEDIAFTVRGVRDCHNRLRLSSATEEERPPGGAHGQITRVGVPR